MSKKFIIRRATWPPVEIECGRDAKINPPSNWEKVLADDRYFKQIRKAARKLQESITTQKLPEMFREVALRNHELKPPKKTKRRKK